MATRYANNDNHTSQPLPSPPLSSSTSPRRNRGISFGGKSEKSHKSSGSHGKISLHETPEEKARRALHTKADPTLAMNEAQPGQLIVFCGMTWWNADDNSDGGGAGKVEFGVVEGDSA
jgi:hypothetical protein